MSSGSKFRLLGVALSIVAILALTAGPALAQQAENATSEAGESEIPVTQAGGVANAVVVVTEDVATTVFCCAEIVVARANIGVAADSDLLLAEFSAETACSGTGAPDQCYVRVRAVNTGTGAVIFLLPSVTDLVFDSEDPNARFAESHSHQFARRLPGGNYQVQVLARTSLGGAFFLDERTLSVTRFA